MYKTLLYRALDAEAGKRPRVRSRPESAAELKRGGITHTCNTCHSELGWRRGVVNGRIH